MLLLAAAALATVPQPTALKPPPANCPRTTSYLARDGLYRGKRLAPSNLTELPPANLYVAVLRRDGNGCEVPIVVRYNLGR